FQDTFANAQPTINDPNIWLLKISAEGCLHQDCPSEQIITSVAALPTVEQRLLVYPNPVENQLTIELPHPPSASRPTALSVFNQQGQLLRSLQLKQQQTTLSLAELSPGSYFLRAQPLQKNLVFTTQIIKL
ncbi:MAG: T9SS type A sorting domain-containing protein, partial [Bacteroidota bacterium]